MPVVAALDTYLVTVSDAELRAEVLQMAHEDLFGLYEAWWRANAMYPDTAVSERLTGAERAIASLLADGQMRLYRGTWEEQAEIPADEVSVVLRDARSWHVPDDDKT